MDLRDSPKPRSSILEEIAAVAEEHSRLIAVRRVDVKRDAESVVVELERSTATTLPDHTEDFLDGLRVPVPKTGRIIFIDTSLFGSQGSAKTSLTQNAILELLEYHGHDNCAVYISKHLPTLVDAMRDRRKPVTILFLDDALSLYNSRAGGNKELLKGFDLYFRMRHKLAEALNSPNGIVYVFKAAQTFKGLEKVFRISKFNIFKSFIAEDLDEINTMLRMSSRARNFLQELEQDISGAKHKQERLSDGVIFLPGMFDSSGHAGGMIRMKFREDEVVERALRWMGTPGCLAALSAKGPGATMQRYKALEAAWTLDRRGMDEKEEQLHIHNLLESLAMRFAQEDRADTAKVEGKAVARRWLQELLWDESRWREYGLAAEDYVLLSDIGAKDEVGISSQWVAEFCAKVVNRRNIIKRETVLKYTGSSDPNDKRPFLRYVAERLIMEHGFNPAHDGKARTKMMTLLYELEPELQGEALKSKQEVYSMALRVWDEMTGAAEGPVRRSSKAKAASTAGVRDEIQATVQVNGEENGQWQFFPSPKTKSQPHPGEAAITALIQDSANHGVLDRRRQLIIAKTCLFLSDTMDGRVMSDPHIIAETDEGKKWQVEQFGKAVDRTYVTKLKIKGEKFFYNTVGLMFEAEVTQHLLDGWVIPGVFDKARIRDVHNFGGNEHDPDIVVEYEDGTTDYVSCKLRCREQISIPTHAAGKDKDEIAPERRALKRDEQKGIKGNRIVVLMRNIMFDGFQAANVYESSERIPETLAWNRDVIGKYRWINTGKPVRPPTNKLPEGRTDVLDLPVRGDRPTVEAVASNRSKDYFGPESPSHRGILLPEVENDEDD